MLAFFANRNLLKTSSLLFKSAFFFTGIHFPEDDETLNLDPRKKPRGALTICPTPIGNLLDISIRQYDILSSVDIIACEDTRRTGKLLEILKEKGIPKEIKDSFGYTINNFEEKEEDPEVKKEKKNEANEEDEWSVFEKELIEKFREKLSLEERRKFDEKLRIEEIKRKTKRLLDEQDTLHFHQNDAHVKDYYGLDDEFLDYLKDKITQSKDKKGRGILISYFKDNEKERIGKLVQAMKYGFKVALVSDAGTPTISDPGHRLVDTCLKEGITVESLPGPSSVTVAISNSGFPADRFLFEGYLPKNVGDRVKHLEKIKNSYMTCVCFENSQRMEKTLLSVEKVFGERQMIYVGYELTKYYEKSIRNRVRQIYEEISSKEFKNKGEAVLIIPPYTENFNDALIDFGQASNKEKTEATEPESEPGKDKAVHNLDELHLASVLDSSLEVSDSDLADLISKVLRISKNRSFGIVKRLRHDKNRNPNRFIKKLY